VKSAEFSNPVGDTTFRTLELYGLLTKEFHSRRQASAEDDEQVFHPVRARPWN
jgi:hypothetical protein